MACLFGHKWNGCKCTRCGKIRDEGHAWNGCTCTICGKSRDEGHVWKPTKNACVQVCSRCGRQKSNHQLDEKGCCTVCKEVFVPKIAFSKEEFDLIIKAVGFKKLTAPGRDKEKYDQLLGSLLADPVYFRRADLQELPFGPLFSLRMDLPFGSPERLQVDRVRKKVEAIAYKGVQSC